MIISVEHCQADSVLILEKHVISSGLARKTIKAPNRAVLSFRTVA